MSNILLYGAGGHAKVVAEVARAVGLSIVDFLEDDEYGRDGEDFFGLHVISWGRFSANVTRWKSMGVALAIGDNAGRERSLERLRRMRVPVITLIHPSSVISASARVGEGTAIMPLAVVNADAAIGEGVIVNTGAVVEHDTTVGDFVHLSANAVIGGRSRIGHRVHLGLGSVVLPRVSVGADAVVGAGAVVVEDVLPGTTVVGVPARPLRTRDAKS